MSAVLEPSGIYTESFNDLHGKLQKAVELTIETDIKPFLEAQKAACMDVRLINHEWRDLVDMYMDSLWLDCLGERRSQEVQSRDLRSFALVPCSI